MTSSALPTAGAQVAGTTAAPKKAPSAPDSSASSALEAPDPSENHELTGRIGAAKAGSLKDAQALLGLLRNDLLKDSG